MYTPGGKSSIGGRSVSSGRAEGRFLEPSQLKLQATGGTIVEKPRDFVRPALDFRLTKDTGVVRSVGDSSSQPSHVPPRRAHSGDAQHIAGFPRRYLVPISNVASDHGYLHMYNGSQEEGAGDLSETGSGSSISANRKVSRSSSATPTNSAAARVATNVDRVMIAESMKAPGVPIIYRTAEERAANPDRLNLDRRRLVMCPVLDGEEQLRLLNYQHNLIRKISNLQSLRKLIFLDLYDNQIEEISGLSNLRSLRVLMLGKNRIKKIEHLDSLVKLDVLDLHGNEIQVIENIKHLTELRVLNLAGNRITFVDNLMGMGSLAELNLRRNQINSLTGIDYLPSLQRLFLSCNEIASFDDIKCLSRSVSLQEISLDGNPIASDQFYKQNILSSMQQIRQLDMKRVTDEEKRISTVMARKEEDRKREMQKISLMKEKRKQAINTAKQQWELMQSTMMGKSNRLTKMPDFYGGHGDAYEGSDVQDEDKAGLTDSEDNMVRSQSVLNDEPVTQVGRGARGYGRTPAQARSQSESRPTNPMIGTRPEVHDRGNGLAELDGDTLTCYGPGSVDSLDRNWGITAAGAVNTIVFKFIEFGDVVAKAFTKIRSKFPAAHAYDFTANNIYSLYQLNALAQLRRIESLTIREEGNPVTQISMWRSYLLFRLSHFSIKYLNGQEVTASQIMLAEKLFGPVSQKVGEYLPNFRLLTLLPEPRKKQLLVEEKAKNAEAGVRTGEDNKSYGSETNSKAVLSYCTIEQGLATQQENTARKKLAHDIVSSIAMDISVADQLRTKVNKVWDKSFTNRVQGMCVNMLDTENYATNKMDKFLASEAS
ncbi:leucine-rich repeat-containing protein 49-like [Watersipora subatra]|uniref:leucine-rich repeat-containing protein 49-like n=1 Tax=Watersipora subatra TaxID=2589382 RepID=UPI00355C0E7C